MASGDCIHTEVVDIWKIDIHASYAYQGLIQAFLKSGRQHKKLNLLTEFSNSVFTKIYFKAC